MKCYILYLLLITCTTGKAFAHSASFTENKGQITNQYGKPRHDIDFKLRGGNVTVFIGNGQLHYQWTTKTAQNSVVTSYRMDVCLLGANPKAEIITEDKQEYFENYYLPQCPKGVIAYSYKRVTYKNIYPNIDWVLYFNGDNASNLKYDFIVHKGGNAQDIKIKYSGTTSLYLDDGNLNAICPSGQIIENAPYSYNSITKKRINSKFALNNDIVSFEIEEVSKEDDFVIDPTISWATYYGMSGDDIGVGVATDILGNAYLAGNTISSSNIATTGAYQSTYGGNMDGMLIKFNEAGQRIWATYYGGTGKDKLIGLAIDSAGNVYVGGSTFSTSSISTPGTVQPNNAGNMDCFVAKFNSSGTRQWGTYYGGANNDTATSITCDKNGNVFIAAYTTNSGLATSGSHQQTYGGNGNPLIVKLTTNGGLLWGTYYGGTLTTPDVYIHSMACDANGNLYAGGSTKDNSAALVSTGAHQTIFGCSSCSLEDGLLVKFSTGGTRQWATFYGGTGDDIIRAVCTDDSGNIYIGGFSGSTNNIATAGSYQSTGGSTFFFLAKLNSSGVRQWGTYYGGAGGAYLAGLAKGITGNIYAYGGQGGIGITTSDAYQTTALGSGDRVFLTVFNTGGYPVYGTFFGGPGDEFVNESSTITAKGMSSSIACSYTGRVYFGGSTNSSSSLATLNGWQTSYGGSSSGGLHPYGDAFLASFIMDTLAYLPMPFTDTSFCPGDSVHISFGVSSRFRTSNTFQLELSNSAGNFTVPVIIGTLNSDTAGIIHGIIPLNVVSGNNYRMRIVSTSPLGISLRDTMPIRIKPVAAGFSASSNTPICAGDTLRLYGSSNTPGLTWNWSGPVGFTSISKDTVIANAQSNRAGDYVLTATLNGCAIRDTETITVKPLPAKPNAGSNTPLCAGSNLNLTASSTTSGISWSWTGPTSFSSTFQNPTRTSVTTADAGNYIVSAILNGCATRDTEAVVINPIPPTPTAGSNSPLCTGNTLSLTASPVAGASYSWTGPAGFSSAIQNPSRANVQLSHAGIYNVTATVNGCTSPAGTTNVAISTGPSVSIYVNPNDTICTGGTATFVAIPTNGGTTPQYKWYRNSNFTGTVTPSYPVTTPINGDVFYCELTNNTTCALPASNNSNSITLTVLPTVTPSVTVTANPAGPVPPFQLISFTATPVNGGSSPQYQWTRNGTNVTGATATSWGATTLSNHDTVCVWLTSSAQCPNPKTVKSSNCVTVTILTGVDDINNPAGIALYPNPNDGHFTLHATGIAAKELQLEILDATGRTVYRKTIAIGNNILHEDIDAGALPNGIYLLKLQDAESVQTHRFTIQR